MNESDVVRIPHFRHEQREALNRLGPDDASNAKDGSDACT